MQECASGLLAPDGGGPDPVGAKKHIEDNHMSEERKKAGVDLGLSDEEKEQLRSLVRDAIQHQLNGTDFQTAPISSKNLAQPRGAFVSLHRRNRLRGCIGHIQPDRPLFETIQEMAVAAAFEDPRFPPLRSDEYGDLDIEISVLTPLQKISDISEIEVGKHGIYIVKEFYAGLLLPQVAVDYGWDRLTFLQQTCLKAGLPADAWKEGDAKIYIFSADIF